LVPLEVGLVFDHFNKRLQEKQSILIYGNTSKATYHTANLLIRKERVVQEVNNTVL